MSWAFCMDLRSHLVNLCLQGKSNSVEDNICCQLMYLPGGGRNYLQSLLVMLIIQEASFKMWWDTVFLHIEC